MKNLEPKQVFAIFEQITHVPRPSKHEEKISQWLVDFAAGHGIECVRDEALNVICECLPLLVTSSTRASSFKPIWTWSARKTVT